VVLDPRSEYWRDLASAAGEKRHGGGLGEKDGPLRDGNHQGTHKRIARA